MSNTSANSDENSKYIILSNSFDENNRKAETPNPTLVDKLALDFKISRSAVQYQLIIGDNKVSEAYNFLRLDALSGKAEEKKSSNGQNDSITSAQKTGNMTNDLSQLNTSQLVVGERAPDQITPSTSTQQLTESDKPPSLLDIW